MKWQEAGAVLLTLILLFVGLFVLQWLNQALGSLAGVAITLLIAAGGVLAYAKGRLDEMVSHLEEVRKWLMYPFWATWPITQEEIETGRLMGVAVVDRNFPRDYVRKIATQTTKGLTEAFGRISNRIRDDIPVKGHILSCIVMLQLFLTGEKDADSEGTDKWLKEFRQKMDDTANELGQFEAEEFRMRNWLPRWLANKYRDFWNWYRDLI